MFDITARSTKDEIIGAAMELADSQAETVAELRHQRTALVVIIAILATMLSL